MKTRSTTYQARWGSALLATLISACSADEPDSPLDTLPPGEEAVSRTRRYLDGLQEMVTIVKSPTEAYALRASGEKAGISSVLASNQAALEAKYGRLAPSLGQELEKKPATERLPITLVFDAGVDWAALSGRLASDKTEERAKANADVAAAIEAAGNARIKEWSAAGLTVTSRSDALPIIQGTATVQSVQKIAKLASVRLVMSGAEARTQYEAAPNSISDPHSDVAFNARGVLGATQRVGAFEGGACTIFKNHEAFSSASGITEFGAAPTCTRDEDCIEACGYENGSCLTLGAAKRCVGMHVSQVTANMVASRDGQPWGAAKAGIFVYNPAESACNVPNQVRAYEWFDEKDVTTVPESWNCLTGDYHSPSVSREHGLVQDHIVRASGISIFKAAGNQVLAGKRFEQMEACAGTLNSICVGATTAGASAMMATGGRWSAWINPAGTDREEPDLTALGVDTLSHAFASTKAWESFSGTSAATPIAAGVAALLKDECRHAGRNVDRDPLFIKAALQLSGWMRNTRDWRYSTPNSVLDQHDGAGGIDANMLPGLCYPPSGSGPGVISRTVDLRGGRPLPEGKAPPIDMPPPGEQKALPDPSPDDGRVSEQLLSFPGLRSGNRLRALIAWNSCPATMHKEPSGPSAVATDFDLFLRNKSTGSYEYASQSVDDNGEGFDVTIDEPGDYEVILAWPKDNPGCGGPYEPLAYGWAIQ
jgi:subtilisin family serine protease